MRMFPCQDRLNGFINNTPFIQCHFVGLQTSTCIPFVDKSDYITQVSTYNEIRKCKMALLLALDPVSSPCITPNDGASVVYKFVKSTMIPAVESKIGLCKNIFGASDELDALQDNCLKNDHPIGVPLLSLYDAKLHCKD